MNTSNGKLLFPICLLILGFNECTSSEGSCLTGHSKRDGEAFQILATIFDMFEKEPSEEEVAGSSEGTTFRNILDHQYNDIQNKILTGLNPDIIRMQKKIAQKGLDFETWLVQGIAVHYAIEFINGYDKLYETERWKAIDCAYVAAFMAAFASEPSVRTEFSKKFLNKIKENAHPSTHQKKFMHKLQTVVDDYSEKSGKLRPFFNAYYKKSNEFSESYTKEFYDINIWRNPYAFCGCAGEILYASSPIEGKATDRMDLWNMAKELGRIIDNPDETNKLTKILRRLEMPEAPDTVGFSGDKPLQLVGKRYLGVMFHLRIQKIVNGELHLPYNERAEDNIDYATLE